MKRYRWTFRSIDEQKSRELAQAINVSMPLARILSSRGVGSFEEAKSFFRPESLELPSAFLFTDMQKAVERIQQALERGEHILLYGDYDVDGTMSISLLTLFLKARGAELSYYINDRFTEGYGLSDNGVAEAARRGAGLVITVDCGISALNEIAALQEQGIDVIVCDHHEPGAQLPSAFAVLNPKVSGCRYPFRELCGCGVAFKLVQALSSSFGLPDKEWEKYLDLVAIATVADLVPLSGENRRYIRDGLLGMKARPRMSIRELCGVMGQEPSSLNAMSIAFGIAPRINAAGRMQTAATAVELMTAPDPETCRSHAEKLEELNLERREIDAGIMKSAEELVENYFASYVSSLVLYREEWHLGVLGIVASRLQEKYYLPTVVLGGSDGLIKGSVRSISGLNIYEVLKECGDLLVKFGGHEAAAGLTILPEQLQAFRKRFDTICSEKLGYEERQKELVIDTELGLDTVTPNFMKVLGQFAPYGLGNPEPVFFTRGLAISGYPRLLKGRHAKFSVRTAKGKIFDVIAFSREDIYRALERGSSRPVSLAYTLEENVWNGRTSVQLKLKDIAFEA